MANNNVITSISVDSASDDGKVPTYNSTTNVFDMTTPGGGGSSAITVIPQSVVPLDTASNSPTFIASISGAPTVALVGQVIIPQSITVNKVTIKVQSTDSDNSKLALYSQDGQTKYIDETFDTTSTAMVTNTLGAPVALSAGIYYVAYTCQDATGGPGMWSWDTSWGTGSAYDVYVGVSGEPIAEGYMTISSFTMPATFNPTSAITAGQGCTALFRLDN